MDKVAIEVKDLIKTYKLYNSPSDRLKETLNPFRKKYHKEFNALKGISIEVKKGETVGIIGKNGSGKSTLLKIVTGVLTPTSGYISVNGKISALLELGAGFNPEYTGIENIYLNGTMMGFSKEKVSEKIPEILKFADIGDFVNQPIKTYSSGMFVRLAFAVAINVDPDILIVDEALSVGDIFFQQKCYLKIKEMIKKGVTVIFVSHDLDAVRNLCDRAIVLEKGSIVYEGDPIKAIHYYHAHSNEENDVNNTLYNGSLREEIQDIKKQNIRNLLLNLIKRPKDSDFCTKDVEILGVKVSDKKGNIRYSYDWGEEAIFTTIIKVNKMYDILSNGILIFDRFGHLAWGSGTINCGFNIKTKKVNEIIMLELAVKLNLQPGEYTVTIGVSSPELSNHAQSGKIHDRFEKCIDLKILDFNLDFGSAVPYFGVAPLPIQVNNIISIGDYDELSANNS